MRYRADINVVDEHPNSHRENEPDYLVAPDTVGPAVELVDDLGAIDSWAPDRRREGYKKPEKAEGEKTGIFLRIPGALASQWPKDRGGDDNSPPHFTILYGGDVPDDRKQEWLDIVGDIIARTAPIPVELSPGVSWFTSEAEDLDAREIAHKGVHPKTAERLADLHNELRAALEGAGFVIKHFAGPFKAHSTLQYRTSRDYDGPVPEGGWVARELEAWGWTEDIALPLGTQRTAAMFDVPPMMWSELSELVTTALRWFKSGGDGTAEPPRGLRNGYVQTTIPVDVTGWRYASDIDETRLPEVVNVVIHTEMSEPPPRQAFGNWIDDTNTLKLWFAGDALSELREDDMLANARHELMHAAQTLLQRGRGLRRLPGLGPQSDPHEEPNPHGLPEFKRNIDMYPYLANEIAAFEAKAHDMTPAERREAARVWVTERPRFTSLREHDETRWRKMTTEFIRAVVNGARQADLLPGGAGDDLPDDLFDPDALARGIAEESEHTDNLNIAREIAKDHLTDDPEYYSREAQLKWLAPAVLGFGVGTMTQSPRDESQAPTATQEQVQYSQADIKQAIHSAAIRHGVDPQLFDALIYTESRYKPHAHSSAGAMGLAQLMPGTAAELGVDDPFDVEQNLDGGARYLKAQLNAFNGDVERALAAYNAGPTAVRKYKGVPPNTETQKYVKAIMSRWRPSKDGSAEHTAESGFNLADLTERQTNVPHRMNTHRDTSDSYRSWNQSEDPMDKMGAATRGTVVIMRGLPGSGKSTAVRKLQQEYGVEPVVCSADHHFERNDGTYAFNPAELPLAHKACRERFNKALAAGAPLVVVDNTNTQVWEFEPYVWAAKAAGYDVRVETTHGNPRTLAPETLDEWSRRNVHGVPRSAYDRMVKRWEDYSAGSNNE